MLTVVEPVAVDPATTGVPFCSIAVVTRQRRGKLTFLVLKRVRKGGQDAGREEWVFPGGMQEFCDSANPLRVIDRELFEESGLCLKPNLKVDPPVLQRERKIDGHYRYFYHFWKSNLTGSLRETVKEDASSILHVPTWEDMVFIEENLYRSQRGVLFKLRELNATRSLR